MDVLDYSALEWGLGRNAGTVSPRDGMMVMVSLMFFITLLHVISASEARPAPVCRWNLKQSWGPPHTLTSSLSQLSLPLEFLSLIYRHETSLCNTETFLCLSLRKPVWLVLLL